MNDEMEFLQTLRDQLQAGEKRIEASAQRFIAASNPEEIKTALQQVPAIRDQQEAAKASGLLKDDGQDIDVRILSMQKLVSFLGEDRSFIETCLSLISNTSNDPRLRQAAFKVLQTLSFSSRVFASVRVEFIAVLRALLDDPQAPLRAMAAEELAKIKDEYVQRRLLAGLKSSEKKSVNQIVPRDKAIQLLGYDIHAEHYPIVRAILQESTATESEKVEAIHVLASDTSSANLLANMMLDKTQENEVRMTSASALRAVQPEQFIKLAKNVILDETEEPGVRAVCINGMMHHLNSDAVVNDPEFHEGMSKLRKVRLLPELRKASKKYMEEVEKRNKQ